MQRSFDISVMTPLGKFSGTLEFTAENTVVHGFLSFLGMKSQFEGEFINDNLAFSGAMETPLGKIDYKAKATVFSDGIEGEGTTSLGVLSFSSYSGRRRKPKA